MPAGAALDPARGQGQRRQRVGPDPGRPCPTRDGRIGNGVGLYTPAAALNILRALQQQGYPVEGLPNDGTTLIHQLLGGVTNDLDDLDLRPCAQSLALDGYPRWFRQPPAGPISEP